MGHLLIGCKGVMLDMDSLGTASSDGSFTRHSFESGAIFWSIPGRAPISQWDGIRVYKIDSTGGLKILAGFTCGTSKILNRYRTMYEKSL